MSSSFKDTRRGFFKTTAALGVGYWVAGRANADDAPTAATPAVATPNKVNFACIGVGGKGDSDSKDAARLANIVAICDVDEDRLAAAAQRFPNAKKFYDFRELFDEMSGQIDAVTVSTPDHTHAPAAIRAMKEGKAVYCQKPLTHSIWEARRMGEVARETKVVTQMGNQGTSLSGLRRSAAIVQAGRWARCARFTSGRIGPSGRKADRGPNRSRCRRTCIGIPGWAPPPSASTATVMPRLPGEGGGILGPARWATWPVTR